ncbi:glycosyltransferase family 4 protein [Agarivorans gilvus]|uniref:Polysaccharide biosynthesis protein n=1 Tax=Agarivorans gilvus TaxID=680279 RepID=A0ABQ1I5M8_9ALTE|nr:glycosyltransferase family 4 protein [Agarivorans gilvus]GGB12384.1 polysaccharide biosynthesis protein [Agarivorans gilvus]
MKIISLGTKQQGGIDSVIKAYEEDGFYATNVQHIRIATHHGDNKWKDALRFPMACSKIVFQLLSTKFSIVHAHMSYKGSFWRKLICLLLAKACGAKTIIHLHGSEFKDFYQHSSRFTQYWIRWLVRHCDQFVVLSQGWADYIKSISGVSATVIPNYIKVRPSIAIERKTKDLLFLGALIDRKGIFDLAHACAALTDKSFTLHICGAGDKQQAFTDLIAQLGIDDKIVMHGWIDTEQKQQLLKSCTALVLPSYNEGLPMVILEAMAYKLPIVSTTVGAIPEVLKDRDSALLYAPGDIESLSQKLSQLLASPSLQRQLSERAFVIYQDYTPEKVLPNLGAVYENLYSS